MRRLGFALAVATVAGAQASPAAGQALISRTITIDGSMSDWMAAPAIPASAGQTSTDCEVGQACETDPVQSTGRDLKHFAYTWDGSNLYFYVERYASSTNITTWLFYLDEDVDGLMEAGERYFAVDWQGTTRSTGAALCVYAPAAPGGDPLGGDGATLPGATQGACSEVYGDLPGGAASGTEMESMLPWSALGRSGPSNVAFHISSSRGTNLPLQVEDNMTGPGGGGGASGGGGGQLFPPDLAVDVAVTRDSLAWNDTSTVRVRLRNVYFDTFGSVKLRITLPPRLAYAAHAAPAGTSFVDLDANGVPEEWQIATLAPADTLELFIRVRGTRTPIALSTTTAAALLAGWSGPADSQAGNNADSVQVAIRPSPELVVTKTVAAGSQATPGSVLTYTTTTSNPAHAPAHFVVVTGQLDPNLEFSLDTYGIGAPFQYAGLGGAGLSVATVEYSADGGAQWNYAPASGGGGAPPGYDGAITHWRITMSGLMASHGATFEIRYAARVR